MPHSPRSFTGHSRLCVICKQQVVLQLAETANSVGCVEHWNSLKLVYIALHENIVMVYHSCCKSLLLSITCKTLE